MPRDLERPASVDRIDPHAREKEKRKKEREKGKRMKKGRGRRQRSRRRISRVGRNLRGRGAQLIAIIAPWKSVIILISREMMAWLLEDLRKLEIVYAKKKKETRDYWP